MSLSDKGGMTIEQVWDILHNNIHKWLGGIGGE